MNQSGTADSVCYSSLTEVYSVEGFFYFTPLTDGQGSFLFLEDDWQWIVDGAGDGKPVNLIKA